VEPLGPKLAEGRDSEIYEHGAGRVLRVNRVARDLSVEARVMQHVRAHGYPVPEVFDAGDGWLLMERVDGVDLLDAIRKTPAGVRRAGALLADLHAQLGAIAAPDWMPAAPGPAGDRVVHLDLHPMNVMMTAAGPVVIDWGNAKRGVPALDVANTWSLLYAGQIPGGGVDRLLAELGRGMLRREFLKRCDRAAAARVMQAVVDWRAVDRNMSPKEIARLRRLALAVA
jgi:aminoglycoside phosphotransferase (APT) family kinase protein